jgi:hypothetical protein
MHDLQRQGSPGAGVSVYGYIRVSTDRQHDSGLGLEAQQSQIGMEVERRGWLLTEVFVDAASGGTMKRPELQRCLAGFEAGDVLVVAKLDRLSRSLMDFASLMDRSKREGWAIVALDMAVDTSTPSGRVVANVMASFAQYERELGVGGEPAVRASGRPRTRRIRAARVPWRVRFFTGPRSSRRSRATGSARPPSLVIRALVELCDEQAVPEHLRRFKTRTGPVHGRIVVPDLTATLGGRVDPRPRKWAPKHQLRGGAFDKAWDKQRRILYIRERQLAAGDDVRDGLGQVRRRRPGLRGYDEPPPEDIRTECLRA